MADTLPEEVYATFAGLFDQQSTYRFFHNFALAIDGGVKKVHLLLQSSGGLVGDGIALYNYLRNLPIEILTYNAGLVSSMAVIVFLAGKKRFCSKHATFMIHKTTIPFQAPANADLMRLRTVDAELNDKNTEAILRAHINLPDEKWALMQRDTATISAQEAVQFAFVHEIADFVPPPGCKLFNI